MKETALIIVDVQNDFLPPSGSLAVPGGREIIPLIKGLLDDDWTWTAVVATQDYHPRKHISFASTHQSKKPLDTVSTTDGWEREVELTLWPDHCIQGSEGTEIDEGLQGSFGLWTDKMKLVRKGWDTTVENYSAFEGYITDASEPSEPPQGRIKRVAPPQCELTRSLKEKGIRKVVVVGLATDFCVNHTALSAIEAGFHTAIAQPYVRGIDPSSVKRVLQDIESKGGEVLETEDQVRRWAT